MIDFHSHILPGIDDGSSSVEESLEMLACYPEEVTDICLTPHFYPSESRPETFFARREEAYQRLLAALEGKEHPTFHLGAEVHYFSGISRSTEMEDFRVEGTRLLLIEMPQGRWSFRMIDELLELNRSFGLRPVLAHIDRYDFANGANAKCLRYFLENRGLVQVNADAFASFFPRRKALSMFRKYMIHFIGSDAHNLSNRRPNMAEALTQLHDSRAEDVLELLDTHANRYFY